MNNFPFAVFAGGCFWCTESDFRHLDGVIEVTSGYSGGHLENPSYTDVTSETSGHREAVQIVYDPQKISYQDLVRRLLTHIDPTDGSGQFYDRGESYEPVIFYIDEEQKKTAEENIQQLNAAKVFDKPVAVKILPYKNFYKAEDYHQNYSEKNDARYCSYRSASGRDDFIKKIWGDKKWIDIDSSIDEDELKTKLTPLQYEVTQHEATEPAFNNEYWDNHEDGIYVDIVTGKPLFSSKDKYDSGTGWPSFTRPIDDQGFSYKTDNKLGYSRTEVKIGSCHLGHVFDDGPSDKGGKRYCMNSAALRFIPRNKLKEEGYEQFLRLFQST